MVHQYIKRVVVLSVCLKALYVAFTLSFELHGEWVDDIIKNKLVHSIKNLNATDFQINTDILMHARMLVEFFYKEHLSLLGFKFEAKENLEIILFKLQ